MQQLAPHTLSPFSETGPADSPFGPRRATVPSDATPGSIFSSPFGAPAAAPPTQERSPFNETVSFSSPFGQQEEHHDDPPVPSYALGRRTSVSAESLVPTNQRPFPGTLESTAEEDETTPNPNSSVTPSFPKSEDQLQRIRSAIKPNFLFRNLDEEQEADVLAAMKEVTLGAGELIIEQGAAGDYFYVVESGTLEVYVKRDGQVINPEQGDKANLGKKVATCVEGNSFGELALMHKWVKFKGLADGSAPRAASIVSTTPCVLWALDRVSFRTILLDVSTPLREALILAHLAKETTLRDLFIRSLHPRIAPTPRKGQNRRRPRIANIHRGARRHQRRRSWRRVLPRRVGFCYCGEIWTQRGKRGQDVCQGRLLWRVGSAQ